MMRVADVIVYDQTKNIQLIVEIKNKIGASADWAAQMRRNLLTHAAIPNAPYFLLALPDISYLWVDSRTQSGEVLPNYQFNTKEALFSEVKEANLSLDNLNEYSLELLIVSWLQEVINSGLPEQKNGSSLQWLFDSGLYEAIKGGALATEAMA